MGSLIVVAPKRNVCAVAAGAECCDVSKKSDCSMRMDVSVPRMASMMAADVLPGRAVSRRSMLETVLANGMMRFLSMFQH